MDWNASFLLEAFDGSVAIYELDGTVVFVNAVTARLFGASREALVGTKLWERFPDAVGNPFYQAFQRVRASGTSETFDDRYPPFDRWYRNQIHRFEDRIYILATDITAAKHAEGQLAVLARASSAFSATRDFPALLQELVVALAEGIGDGCAVRVREGATGPLRLRALHHTNPATRASHAAFFEVPLDESDGLTGRLLASGAPVLIPHVDAAAHQRTFRSEAHRRQVAAARVHSVMAAAVSDGERRIGMVVMTRDETAAPYTESDLTLLADVSERASLALARVRAFERVDAERHRASVLAAASRAFAAAERKTEVVLGILARAVGDALGAQATAEVRDDDGAHTRATHPNPLAASSPTDLPLQAVTAPIEAGGRMLGMVTALRDPAAPACDAAEVELLAALADRAALALENVRVVEAERAARERAERAASRTSRLQRLTALWSTALSAEEASAAIVESASDGLGAGSAVVWLLSNDGTSLDLVAADPALRAFSEPFRKIPRSAPLPVNDAIDRGDVVLLPSPEERLRRYPALGDGRDSGFRSWAAIPLEHDGRALGVFSLSFVEQRGLADDELAFLRAVAQQCSQALVRTRLYEAERSARANAERVAAQTARLLAVTTRLAGCRAQTEVAPLLIAETIPAFGGSHAAVWRIGDTRTTLRMAASVGSDEAAAQYAELSLDADMPIAVAARTATPLYLGSRAEYAARFPSSAARVQALLGAPRALACLPLLAEGRLLGAFVVMLDGEHTFLDDERAFLEVLASQCAQTLARTERAALERAANRLHAETSRTLRAVVDASPAAILLLELDGTLRIWSAGAEKILGWAAAEMVGSSLHDLPEANAAPLRQKLAQVSAGESIAGVELTCTSKEGRDVDVAMWATQIQSPHGAPQCLFVLADITDRKTAERAARAADRRKDEFLAILGHELRNPLAPILTALQLLRMRGVAGIDREREIIERQTRHLMRLVDDLLDVSRIARGVVELRRAPVDVAALLARAVEMVSPLLEERRHRLSIDAATGRFFVDGDEHRLAQVLQNILANAAKYTPPEGNIGVRLAERDGNVRIEVEDDGPGVDAELLGSIFEPFVQGARSLERSQGGLGIGLAVVRQLVHLHGGTVRCVSDGAGRGARFVVELPALREASLASAPVPVGDLAEVPSSARTILVVDDNADAAELVATVLRSTGHVVHAFHDAPSALLQASTLRPDVAVLDIGLPVMDGYELARRLRAMLPETRLIALTGYGLQEDRARAADAGFDHHLVKPIDVEQLLALARA